MHTCEVEPFLIDGKQFHPPLGRCKTCGALHKQMMIGSSLAHHQDGDPMWDYVAEPEGNNFPDDPIAVVHYVTGEIKKP